MSVTKHQKLYNRKKSDYIMEKMGFTPNLNELDDGEVDKLQKGDEVKLVDTESGTMDSGTVVAVDTTGNLSAVKSNEVVSLDMPGEIESEEEIGKDSLFQEDMKEKLTKVIKERLNLIKEKKVTKEQLVKCLKEKLLNK